MNNVNRSQDPRAHVSSDAKRAGQKGQQGQVNGEELGGGPDGKGEKDPKKQQQSSQEGGKQGSGKEKQGEQQNSRR